MRISVEWFLIDNLLMNRLTLQLGASILGVPMRRQLSWCISAFGAVYALVSVLGSPCFSRPIPKMIVSVVMAAPLIHKRADIIRGITGLFFAACMMAGVLVCLCFLFGGSFRQGILIGTLPLRFALIGGLVCTIMPRTFRTLKQRVFADCAYIPIKMLYSGQTVYIQALVDSGNFLTEPISQKPIIVLKKGLVENPIVSGRPIPYHTLGGDGVLYAAQPDSIFVYRKRWHAVDAMIAETDASLKPYDAVFPMCLMPIERKEENAESDAKKSIAAVSLDCIATQAATALHSFWRNAACTISGRRRTGVDRSIDER